MPDAILTGPAFADNPLAAAFAGRYVGRRVSLDHRQLHPKISGSKWQRIFIDRLRLFQNQLCRFFHTGEIDRDPRLKIICASLLLYYFLTFYHWWQNPAALSTAGNVLFNYVPATIIQNCRWLVFMNYEETRIYLYILAMLGLLGSLSLFYLRSSLLAVGLLAWLFINKVYFYLGDFRLFANYHHFHLFFTLVFLVSQSKLRFFRGALVVGYLMSAVVKISPSWLFGEYFNSLPGKLPLLPKAEWVVTSASVGVFILEFLGPLCWFTSINWLRRLSFGAFILFHLYSGVLVGFWYTTLMLPLVMAAFLRFDRPLQFGYRFSRRQLAAFGIFAVVMLGGFYHFCIPGDVRVTNEGRNFGFFMFDANRQVHFETEMQKGNKRWVVQVDRPFRDNEEVAPQISCKFYQDKILVKYFPDGTLIQDEQQVIFNPAYFSAATMRTMGNPYLYYYYARELVRRYHPDRVAIRLDIQLDGHPEVFRLLDIPDFERLAPDYNSFLHNQWIALPGPDSPSDYRWP